MPIKVFPSDGIATSPPPPQTSKTTSRSFGGFFRKYFLEGQKLDEAVAARISNGEPLSFLDRNRKLIAFAAPFSFFQICWWTLAIRYDYFRLYPTHYEMAITMIFGALVGGATAEGGGAIAFPVMTLILHLAPVVARDFSVMIQSVGMAASSFTVLWMRVKLEWRSIIFSTMGALFSTVIGLQFLDNLFTPVQKKMIFVSIWFAFAVSLLILNLQHKRKTYDEIPEFGVWKALILVGAGMFGGLLTAFTGSGVDICSFSILTLLFRVTEKVATPTSVVLMCLNTWSAFYWRHLIMNEIPQLAWEYFAVCVPVVVTCSPFGAFLSSHLHRQVLASFVYILETAAVIGFLVTKPPLGIIVTGVVIIIIGTVFFFFVSRIGTKISNQVESRKAAELPNLSVSSAEEMSA